MTGRLNTPGEALEVALFARDELPVRRQLVLLQHVLPQLAVRRISGLAQLVKKSKSKSGINSHYQRHNEIRTAFDGTDFTQHISMSVRTKTRNEDAGLPTLQLNVVFFACVDKWTLY